MGTHLLVADNFKERVNKVLPYATTPSIPAIFATGEYEHWKE
jgi:hypothetical protein